MIELDPNPVRRPRRVRESKVERYFVEQCAAHGAVAEKYKSPGRRNVPDRLVMWPDRPSRLAAEINFAEIKKPGEDPTPGQLRDHDRRRKMGFEVYVIRSFDDVDGYIRNCNY